MLERMKTSNDIMYNKNTNRSGIQKRETGLYRSLRVDWRGRAAARPAPVARDHVTITGLSDGCVSKLRKPDYLFS